MSFSRFAFALCSLALLAAAKDPKPAKTVAPVGGVKTPGVLIPFANLKPEASFALASPPAGFHFGDSVALADSSGIRRFDSKTNKAFEPSRDVKEIAKPCGGLVSGFAYLWTPTCGTAALAKVELPPAPLESRGGPGGPPEAKPETLKPSKPPAQPVFMPLDATPTARTAIAASGDSIWLLADGKTSLQRIDPKEHTIVAEIRLPAVCASLLFAEGSLWVACPSEAKLLRLDPRTNLVDKRIEVPAQPVAITAGEGSIWVLGRKEGKIARIDPKTNKVTATIELGIPNADGTLAFGEGALWASAPGFPVMRIAPATDKVVQQFHGDGGGLIAFGLGSVWVGSEKASTVVRFDPKRIQATLAE